MARFSIEDLPRPPKGFDPSQDTARADRTISFETLAAAEREDIYRTSALKRQLRLHAAKWSPEQNEAIKASINDIDQATGPASSRYMRDHRIRIGGHIWALVASEPNEVSFFTLIPRSWEYRGAELSKADPARLKDQLRKALIGAGASESDGWVFISLHGEHEPNEDVFRLHVHGVASGGMVKVVDRLREQKNFRSKRKGAVQRKVYQRLHVTRQPLVNLPDPLTYVVQSFWPAKAIYGTSVDHQRQTKKHRIKEPRHTEVLLWLNETRLRDLTLLMGVRVKKGGLKRS